jgi:hypothetical protein
MSTSDAAETGPRLLFVRERSLGIKIPPTNLKPDFGGEAETFANKLADTLATSGSLDGRRA